jgi:SAM-dependent methyltransferase
LKLRRDQDATGQAVYDHYRGIRAYELVEREDGFLSVGPGPGMYLSGYPDWRRHEKRAIRRVRGRVLDVGCNAGRHALWLQEQGHEVLGIDVSPLAIRTAKLRGLHRARVLSITGVSPRLGMFDTITMLGSNFGLFANPRRARRLLRLFARMTPDRGRIVAESLDPYDTDDPAHLAYHRSNRRRGRMSGQIRLRVRYRDLATPWLDYLFVSKEEMEQIVEGTGWRVARYYDSGGPNYISLLEKG